MLSLVLPLSNPFCFSSWKGLVRCEECASGRPHQTETRVVSKVSKVGGGAVRTVPVCHCAKLRPKRATGALLVVFEVQLALVSAVMLREQHEACLIRLRALWLGV